MSSKTVLITGCGRGIGLEMVRQYAEQGWRVHACARNVDQNAALGRLVGQYPDIVLHELDVTDDTQIAALDRSLGGEAIDLLINNAGVYGPKGLVFGQVERETWRRVLEVNTISPLMVTQALMGRLLAGDLKKVALVSSKVGSIADNGSGGGYYYRSSKTALNQVVKSLSIDLAEQGVKVAALHPGWVQTDMGGPNALIDVNQSVTGLRQVIENLDASSSGGFFDYQGNEIPW
ncbi:SDR family oxidoreductase [Marinobacterium arenosum]|uniref:SDR family oxidoreductase n=1 Tax=Marinobacterium arenosum TaxID=2862496 RepID=UPI001C938C21|nr:SDR family oxidoreductase [Marinobacterium arenosum]MBY4678775.1 SDR family oxidoreductase [Marinobacterium arenosum]